MHGVTAYYEDFRNRSIKAYDAIWLVVNQISGEPEREMNELIETFRRDAK